MLLKAGNKILKSNSRLLAITNDFRLTFEVQGTCFPAKMTQGGSNTAVFRIDSLNSLSNKVFIDYADGTGEHEYNFKSSGTSRQIWFRNLAGATTPSTIQGSNWYDETIHFYQDLPEGVKDTVQETYPQKRFVNIRFENPQNIIQLVANYYFLFGTFPSAISKYNSLRTLTLTQTANLDNFQQDFYGSSIRNLTLSNVGSVMNDGIPDWIVNSNFLEVLNLQDSVNLNDNLSTNNLLNIDNLKDTLKDLNIGGSGINYQLPNSVGNLENLQTFTTVGNTNSNFRFPANIEDMVSLKTINARSHSLPFSEIERVIDETPNLEVLNITLGGLNSNQDITNDNFSIKEIHIGRQTWGGGIPDFINKLKALENLYVIDVSSSGLYTGTIDWGDFSECTTLIRIFIGRLPNFTTNIPAWFSDLVNLKQINAQASFQNTGGVNTFVDNFYDFIVSNASMSVGDTQFRTMSISLTSANATDIANSTRPSGTYQQPSGYVQGSDNGTPASQMEKIWVLVNQYAHTWTVKP